MMILTMELHMDKNQNQKEIEIEPIMLKPITVIVPKMNLKSHHLKHAFDEELGPTQLNNKPKSIF